MLHCPAAISHCPLLTAHNAALSCRSMREDPQPHKPMEEKTFAGDNFVRKSGDYEAWQALNLHALTATAKGQDIHMQVGAAGGTHRAACTGGMHRAACTGRHAQGGMHRAACTGRHA
jgi:hypothetical protein